MGLFSILFDKPKKPAREEMVLLVEYANLAEGIGIEGISRGVDVALLPCSKDRLQEIIARVSLSPLSGLVLKQNDLSRLYGLLAFFFASEELTLLDKARDIEAILQEGLSVSTDDNLTCQEGVSLLLEAQDHLFSAEGDLKAHAGSLGS